MDESTLEHAVTLGLVLQGNKNGVVWQHHIWWGAMSLQLRLLGSFVLTTVCLLARTVRDLKWMLGHLVPSAVPSGPMNRDQGRQW